MLIAEGDRYFREFVLPACRQIGDTGRLIATIKGQLEEWEPLQHTSVEARQKADLLRMVLLLIEARTRANVEALQQAIDISNTFVDVRTLRDGFEVSFHSGAR